MMKYCTYTFVEPRKLASRSQTQRPMFSNSSIYYVVLYVHPCTTSLYFHLPNIMLGRYLLRGTVRTFLYPPFKVKAIPERKYPCSLTLIRRYMVRSTVRHVLFNHLRSNSGRQAPTESMFVKQEFTDTLLCYRTITFLQSHYANTAKT